MNSRAQDVRREWINVKDELRERSLEEGAEKVFDWILTIFENDYITVKGGKVFKINSVTIKYSSEQLLKAVEELIKKEKGFLVERSSEDFITISIVENLDTVE